MVATNIDKDTLVDSISQMITVKVLLNKKTPNGYDSWYLSKVDQREIEPSPETKSDITDANSVQKLTSNIPKEMPPFAIEIETPLLQNIKQIPKP